MARRCNCHPVGLLQQPSADCFLGLPSLFPPESGLSGEESTMGLGRWSGPCRVIWPQSPGGEMWELRTTVGKVAAWTMQSRHEPTSQTEPAVLPGAETIALLPTLSPCAEGSKGAWNGDHNVLSTSMYPGAEWRHSSLQARYFSHIARAPVWAPRPAEDFQSPQKTMPKTPELSHSTPPKGMGAGVR